MTTSKTCRFNREENKNNTKRYEKDEGKIMENEAPKISYRFSSQPIAADKLIHIELLRHKFSILEDAVEEFCRDPRYKAIVLTKLEEASMFATKSISHTSKP